MGRLDDKVAIITGGSGGIGAAAARLFVAEGAKVMAVDLDEAKLRILVDDLSAENAAYAVADVSDEAATEAYVEATISRFGGIDIALLNAGIEGDLQMIPDYPTELYDKVMAVNVRGVWLGLKSVMPEIEKRGGGPLHPCQQHSLPRRARSSQRQARPRPSTVDAQSACSFFPLEPCQHLLLNP